MTQLEKLLAAWLVHQRWFAGKGLALESLAVESRHEIPPGSATGREAPDDLRLWLLIVTVDQHDAAGLRQSDRYQVLLGLRRGGRLPLRLTHAAIGTCELGSPGGAVHEYLVYDAAHDPDLMGRILDALAQGADVPGVRFRTLPGAGIQTGLRSLVITGEQSNSSLVFGEEYVLKVFRRLWPGHNPDLELTSALGNSPYVAPPYGWLEADLPAASPQRGEPRRPEEKAPTTLAMLQRYLKSATDGWVLAATSVRDLYGSPELAPGDAGGDFAGEAERLGAATAAVHRDLAKAMPTDVLRPERLVELSGRMVEHLHTVAAEVPALAPYTDVLREAFDDLAKLDAVLPVQRVHGDYHLGQVVRTDEGWVLLDFEGEPAASVQERQRLSSPLRDVAGMLRSFDYAARYQLIGHVLGEELAAPARAWAVRNRTAFCAGYAEAGGIDPSTHETVLRAFEYDKAVYEVRYEARNRPSWLRIPLDSIAALVG